MAKESENHVVTKDEMQEQLTNVFDEIEQRLLMVLDPLYISVEEEHWKEVQKHLRSARMWSEAAVRNGMEPFADSQADALRNKPDLPPA